MNARPDSTCIAPRTNWRRVIEHPAKESRALRWRGWGVVLAGLGLWLLWSAARSGPPPPQPLACDRAILVDGQLRCDDEVPTDVAALCPAGASIAAEFASEFPRGGDAFDTVHLCAQDRVRRDHPGHGWSRMSPDELAGLQQPVDVNRASIPELTSLPRVGPVLARRIVEGRPYAHLDALLEVRGIGPATLGRLRARATVGPAR